MPQTILIAGGTGLLGSRLHTLLTAQGHRVRILSRKPSGPDEFFWDPLAGKLDAAALSGVDAVINLAGAGIADQRWTPARKKVLIDSRVASAAILQEAIQKSDNPPGAYLSASAIGYYGNSGENPVDEDTPPGREGFMPETCLAWEAGAEKIGALGIRTTVFRIGIVLAADGGALLEMIKPLHFGLGAYFGSGRAWWSWIHLDDVCQMFIWALENPNIDGIFNAVAPHPVRNLELVKSAARAMHKRPLFVSVPALALKLALGEMSAVVLNSNLVSAEKAIAAGFRFHFPELDRALENILQKPPQ